MKEKNKKVKPSWRKNWSSRGTAMMNNMEKFLNPSGKIKINGKPSIAMKLHILLQEYPYNKFYFSLKEWIREKQKLSPKQRQAIEGGFNSLMSKRKISMKKTNYEN